ncbi:MAG: hypothetical protein RL246_2240 [Bacteroidota bacterium]|jgi:hypothetical protein
MSVAIMQPYFFPYLGYFQLVQAADHFVFYDDVMFIKKGWINRNRILMQGNEFLFSIPLEKQSQHKSIRHSTVAYGTEFPNKWLQQIESAYKKAPNFQEVFELILQVIQEKPASVADLAAKSVMETWTYLGLEKKFYLSSELTTKPDADRALRLIHLTQELGESHYINAVNGQSLYDKSFFAEHGVQLDFLSPKLQPYAQGNQAEFTAGLSMIDVLMWNSKEAVVHQLKNFDLI